MVPRLRAALAAAACATTVLLVPATAAPPAAGPPGAPCALVDGVLSGGPYAGAGTLVCTVQVDAPTHAGRDAVVEQATGGSLVYVTPTRVVHGGPAGSVLHVCTEWRGATTLYWHADTTYWSADPGAACAVASGGDDGDPGSGPSPAEPDPWGALCGMTAVGSGNTEEAVVRGGPLLLEGDGQTFTGTLTCTVQVNAATHAGPDACILASMQAGAVAVLPPEACGYAAGSADVVFLCTSVAVAGHGTLHFDDDTSQWTESSGAHCQALVTVAAGPDATRPGKLDHDPRGRHGDRGKGPRDPKAPYHPTGTIEISRSAAGMTNFVFTGFVPMVGEWDCPVSGTSVTCTPPAPPEGSVNVCGSVTTQVTATAPGSVTGTSSCASGPTASATSQGPAVMPQTAAAAPRSAFAWTCDASPAGLVATWTVRCTVGA